MTIDQTNYVKIALAILFFICIFDMPYGFYQLVRTIAMVGFGILAYNSYEREEQNMVIIYLGLLILFQPIIKIPLGRGLWIFVDLIVGSWLLFFVFRKK